MKNIYIIALLGAALLLMSNRGGRNNGATGAPGEGGETCGTCHGGGTFSGAIDITLRDAAGNLVTSYKANETYDITIQLSGQGAAGFGFQAVTLGEDEEQAGSFSDLGDIVRTVNSFDREYLAQSNRKPDGTFSAKWTAPAEGRGNVTIFSSGIAANGNGGTSGDEPLQFNKVFAEEITSSTENVDLTDITIFPNPTSDFITINREENFDFQLISITGKIIGTGEVNSNNPIDVSNLTNGTYLLQIIEGGQSITKRFVKK